MIKYIIAAVNAACTFTPSTVSKTTNLVQNGGTQTYTLSTEFPVTGSADCLGIDTIEVKDGATVVLAATAYGTATINIPTNAGLNKAYTINIVALDGSILSGTWNVMVCGLETISQASGSAIDKTQLILNANTDETIAANTYEAYFSFGWTNSQESVCTKTYTLVTAAGAAVANTIAELSGGNLVIKRDTLRTQTSIFLKVTTLGTITAQKEIQIAVSRDCTFGSSSTEYTAFLAKSSTAAKTYNMNSLFTFTKQGTTCGTESTITMTCPAGSTAIGAISSNVYSTATVQVTQLAPEQSLCSITVTLDSTEAVTFGWKVTVCGSETITAGLAQSWWYAKTAVAANKDIALSTYSAWFSFGWTDSDQTGCTVSYSLCQDATCTAAFTDTSKAELTANVIRTPTKDVFASEKIYVQALSIGGVKAAVILNLEVYLDCTVNVAVVGQTTPPEKGLEPGGNGQVTLSDLLTFTSNDTANCPLDTVSVYSDLALTTQTHAPATFANAVLTFPVTTAGCSTVYVKVLNTNGDHNSNPLKVCVCGLETLSLPDSTTFISTSYVGSGTTTIAGSAVKAWFNSDFSNSGTITDCGIRTYLLFTDSGGSTAWTDTAKVAISSSTTTITVNKNTGFAPQTIYVQAKTLGKIKAYRQMQITVCGYETITMNPTSTPTTLLMYRMPPSSNNATILTPALVNWTIDSTVCPITHTTLYSNSAKTTQVSQVVYGNPVSFTYDQGTPALIVMWLEVNTQAGVKSAMEFRGLVCGLEMLSLAAGFTEPLNHTVLLTASTVGTFDYMTESTFTSWFQLSVGSQPTDFDQCTVQNYYLCDDQSCATFQTNKTFITIEDYTSSRLLSSSSVNTTLIADRSSGVLRRIKYALNETYVQTLYLGAVTKGYIFQARKIDFNISCGGEIVSTRYGSVYTPFEKQLYIGSGTNTMQQGDWQRLWQNDIPYHCPWLNYTLHHPTNQYVIDYRTRKIEERQALRNRSEYEPKIIAKLSNNQLLLFTQNFTEPGNYTFNITGLSKGLFRVTVVFKLIVTRQPSHMLSFINKILQQHKEEAAAREAAKKAVPVVIVEEPEVKNVTLNETQLEKQKEEEQFALVDKVSQETVKKVQKKPKRSGVVAFSIKPQIDTQKWRGWINKNLKDKSKAVKVQKPALKMDSSELNINLGVKMKVPALGFDFRRLQILTEAEAKIAILKNEEKQEKSWMNDEEIIESKDPIPFKPMPAQQVFSIAYLKKSGQSEQENSKMNFEVLITNWTTDKISIGFKFSSPGTISIGPEPDEVELRVAHPYLFISADGKLINTTDLVIRQEVPRQYQSSLNPKQIQAQSVAAVVVIFMLVTISLILQCYFNQNTQTIESFMLIMQLVVHLPLYKWSVSALLQLILRPFITAVNFMPTTGKGQDQFSDSFSSNIMIFIILIAIWVIATLILCMLQRSETAKKAYKFMFRTTLFNALVVWIKISFVRVFASSLKVGNNFFIYLIAYIVFATLMQYRFRDNLEHPWVIDKIGQMNQNLHRRFKYYHITDLIRRGLFVSIPFMFKTRGVQLACLSGLQVQNCIILFYFYPHKHPMTKLQEGFNEFILLQMVNLIMISPIEEDISKYDAYYIALLVLILIFNLYLVIQTTFERIVSQYKQRLNYQQFLVDCEEEKQQAKLLKLKEIADKLDREMKKKMILKKAASAFMDLGSKDDEQPVPESKGKMDVLSKMKNVFKAQTKRNMNPPPAPKKKVITSRFKQLAQNVAQGKNKLDLSAIQEVDEPVNLLTDGDQQTGRGTNRSTVAPTKGKNNKSQTQENFGVKKRKTKYQKALDEMMSGLDDPVEESAEKKELDKILDQISILDRGDYQDHFYKLQKIKQIKQHVIELQEDPEGIMREKDELLTQGSDQLDAPLPKKVINYLKQNSDGLLQTLDDEISDGEEEEMAYAVCDKALQKLTQEEAKIDEKMDRIERDNRCGRHKVEDKPKRNKLDLLDKLKNPWNSLLKGMTTGKQNQVVVSEQNTHQESARKDDEEETKSQSSNKDQKVEPERTIFDIDLEDPVVEPNDQEELEPRQEASVEALLSNFISEKFKPSTPEPTEQSEEEPEPSLIVEFFNSVLDSVGLLPPEDI